MKKIRIVGIVTGFVAAAGFVAVAVYYLGGHYLTGTNPAANVAVCRGRHPAHTVTIRDDVAAPRYTQATLCGTLTIKNTDNELRLIAFGTHEHHVPYDGVTEQVLRLNQSLTITLNQAGTYRFHDHIHDEVTGDFTVTK